MTWVLAGLVVLMGYFIYDLNEHVRELKKAVIQLLLAERDRNPGFPIDVSSLSKSRLE